MRAERFSGSSIASVASAVCLLALATTTASVARAAPPDKAACASTYEQAQRLRRDRKLVKAREALLVCVQDSCPSILRTECVTWLSEVDATLPTVVFEARDAAGAFIADVTVSVGGEVVATRLDGNAVPLDPGERALRFEHAGAKSIEQAVVVREGEKRQKVAVVFTDVGVAPPAAAPSIAPPAASIKPTDAPPAPVAGQGTSAAPSSARDARDAPSSAPSSPIPWSVWALGGIGVVGLGVFGAFAISGYSDVSGKLDACKQPGCDHSAVQSVRTKYLVADIGLGVGVLALGAATLVYFFGRDKAPTRATIGGHVAPSGARAFVGVSF